MKIRDDIRSIEQGMGPLCLPQTDKWGVAFLQVAEAHPPDRKIAVVAVYMMMLGGPSTVVPWSSTVPPSGSMAFGASMPCGTGTSIYIVWGLSPEPIRTPWIDFP